MTYFERMIALRKQHGYSQQRVSEILNIASRSYQYYEYGQREPTVSVIIALADLYGVSTDYLLGVSDDPRRDL